MLGGLGVALPAASASYLDDIGLTQLQATHPTLNGSGVIVGQPEAPQTSGGNDYELNPANSAINYTGSVTYVSSTGVTVTGGTPPNAAGSGSGHADSVATVFFGTNGGVAPGVSEVYNYNANYYYNSLIASPLQPSTPPKVVNQSFSFGSQDATIDQNYDNYAARYHTIFVSAAGVNTSGSKPTSPGTAYNSIAVNVFNPTLVLGPTTDGRSKPDISAPAPPQGAVTSFVTPEVAGSAAILVQAAGSNTNASDERTVKALLLNGAVKPAGWTHTTTTPLDPSYGAGELNINNSYIQFSGGQRAPTSSNTVQGPAGATGAAVASRVGWDFNTITSGTTSSGVSHYLFNQTGTSPVSLTATLAWDRDLNTTGVNNLFLYLYNTTSNTPVDMSTSTADNLQQLYDPSLPAGSYDLEVVKVGGVPGVTAGVVSSSETYALAFNVTPEPSSICVIAGFGALVLTRRPRRPARIG